MKEILNQSIPHTLLTLMSKATLNCPVGSVRGLSGTAGPQEHATPAPSLAPFWVGPFRCEPTTRNVTRAHVAHAGDAPAEQMVRKVPLLGGS